MNLIQIAQEQYTLHLIQVHEHLDELQFEFQKTLPSKIIDKATEFVHQKDQIYHLAGRYLLFNHLKIKNLEKYIFDIHYSTFGKPYFPKNPLNFNISHAGNWVVLATSEKREVGVDIEKIQKQINVNNFKDCFSAREWAEIMGAPDPTFYFTKIWCQKESLLKCHGAGLQIELCDAVTLPEGGYIAHQPYLLYKTDFHRPDNEHIIACSYPY